MTARYKPYPQYKTSGVEWLDDVPGHWDLCRVKYLASLNPSKAEVRKLHNETPVTFIPMEAIGVHGELDVSRTKTLEDVINGYGKILGFRLRHSSILQKKSLITWIIMLHCFLGDSSLAMKSWKQHVSLSLISFRRVRGDVFEPQSNLPSKSIV